MTETEARERYLAACVNYREASERSDLAYQAMLRAHEDWIASDDDD